MINADNSKIKWGMIKRYLKRCLSPFFLAFSFFFSVYLWESYSHPFPQANYITSFKKSLLGDALTLSFGMRRLLADVWFVRLMQYYGTRELSEHDEHTDEHWAPLAKTIPSVTPKDGRLTKADASGGHSSGFPYHHCHHRPDYGSGQYPDFFPMAKHIIDIDPYFKSAVMYSVTSLAFNLQKHESAIALLKIAMMYSKKEWMYPKLLAAIGYSKAKDPQKVAQILTMLVWEPDCPTMVKQLVAFLNKKTKNYKTAYAIYLNILNTSKDPFYLENARKEVEKLKI
jgi:hypothetical protein